MNRKILVYLTIVGVCGAGLWAILQQGDSLQASKYLPPATAVAQTAPNVWKSFHENIQSPGAILLLQIFTIIVAARALGWLMVKIKQPTVVGEILAGIALGPSLAGLFLPALGGFLFPPASLPNLQFLSQIGLILFMFIIGMELDLHSLRQTARDAVVISHAGVVFPFVLGVCLAWFIYREFAPEHITFLAFALFIGVAMSVTAFPVLARIAQERGITKQREGIISLAAAAADDVTAWCMLAVVIAIVKAGSVASAGLTILFTVVFVALMIYAVKPLLEKIATRSFAPETVNKPLLALIFSLLILSAFTTEIIGVHALFGAFIAGVIIPANPKFRRVLANKIEDISLVLLLPLFFVLTGLRTQIGLLDSAHLWIVCGWVILIAVAGKFLGSALAARLVGNSWRESLIVGALMNTRGLMGFVVINIGYDLGVLNAAVFSMMVVMALVTTCMTGPALDAIDYFFKKVKPVVTGLVGEGVKALKLLISFGSPASGVRLLDLASQLGWTSPDSLHLTAAHLSPSADISPKEAEFFEKESFEPILAAASERRLRLQTYYKATNNLVQEIERYAGGGGFDLMLVGGSRPLFSNEETGGVVHHFYEAMETPVAALIDRGFETLRQILIVADGVADHFLLRYLQSVDLNPDAAVTLLDVMDAFKDHIYDGFSRITVLQGLAFDPASLARYDLLLVSRAYWERARRLHSEWTESCPSVVVINK